MAYRENPLPKEFLKQETSMVSQEEQEEKEGENLDLHNEIADLWNRSIEINEEANKLFTELSRRKWQDTRKEGEVDSLKDKWLEARDRAYLYSLLLEKINEEYPKTKEELAEGKKRSIKRNIKRSLRKK